METLDQLKEIVKNSPDGSTHVERIISRGALYFLKRVNRQGVYTYAFYSNEHGSYIDGVAISGEIRSLSDIKLIIELMEYSMRLETKLGIE